jgi:hypothetical protein
MLRLLLTLDIIIIHLTHDYQVTIYWILSKVYESKGYNGTTKVKVPVDL